MAINMEAAQLLVGAAILDSRFCRQLIDDRNQALDDLEAQPCAPRGIRLTQEDRLAFTSIRARSLREFAVGVERLRSVVRPAHTESAFAGLAG
jgi:hypothetical protein